MKKKIIITIFIVLVLLLMVVASVYFIQKNKYADMTLVSQEIYDTIIAKLNTKEDTMMPTMMPIPVEKIQEYYGIDMTKVENYAIYIPLMNVKANEIAVVKVKDKQDIEQIKEKFKSRAAAVAKTFSTYLENQYYIAKNPLIFNKANYVFLILSDKRQEAKQTIEEIFK